MNFHSAYMRAETLFLKTLITGQRRIQFVFPDDALGTWTQRAAVVSRFDATRTMRRITMTTSVQSSPPRPSWQDFPLSLQDVNYNNADGVTWQCIERNTCGLVPIGSPRCMPERKFCKPTSWCTVAGSIQSPYKKILLKKS